MTRCLIVIPARLESTRLPRKLLLDQTGQTLLQHTYESAQKSTLAQRVMIAADDQEIVDACQAFGGDAVMTDIGHQSGTDRVAEVAASLEEYDIIVNVQGDEPEIEGESIDKAISVLLDNPEVVVSTLATPITDGSRLHDPSCVKVVMDNKNQAMYFSRAPIPFPRDGEESWLTADPPSFFQHVGLYAYRRDFLLELANMPAAKTEQIEKLEQLRILEAGFKIGVATIASAAKGIDTREDYLAFVKRQSNC